MTVQQVAVIAAVTLIPIGIVLIGIGTRSWGTTAPLTVHAPVPRRAHSPAASGNRAPRAPVSPADLTEPPKDPAESDFSLVVVETRPFLPAVAPGHKSTSDERRTCRSRLDPELDADLIEIGRLLDARAPQLCGLLMSGSVDVVSVELAALRAYLRGALAGLDTRLREGPLEEADTAVTACLVSGLSRLPVHRGAVFHRAHRAEMSLEALLPGSVLVEPAFTRADRSHLPAGGIDPGPFVNYVIWSESGRHVPLLVGHGDTVLFATGSRFWVLALDEHRDQTTVYLAEETVPSSGRPRRRGQVLEDLRGHALSVGIGPLDGPAPSPISHPGLDENGRPFAPLTGEASFAD